MTTPADRPERDDEHTIGGRRYVSVRDRQGRSFVMPADLEITGPAALEHYREMSEVLAVESEDGRAPWMRERSPAYALPDEPGTRRAYRGANALWLVAVADLRGYSDPRWGNRHQLARSGGRVRRGERGIQVVNWYQQESAPPGSDPKRRIFAEEVFNGEQCDGLAPQADAETRWRAGAPSAREILTGPAIEHSPSSRPHYDAVRDVIVLPPEDSFRDSLDYLRTAMHEVGHWTGHPARLNRETLDRDRGGPPAAPHPLREELRAEIHSLLGGCRLAIGHDPARHARLGPRWAEILRNDPREIYRAADAAERMCAWAMERAPRRDIPPPPAGPGEPESMAQIARRLTRELGLGRGR